MEESPKRFVSKQEKEAKEKLEKKKMKKEKDPESSSQRLSRKKFFCEDEECKILEYKDGKREVCGWSCWMREPHDKSQRRCKNHMGLKSKTIQSRSSSWRDSVFKAPTEKRA